MKDNEGYLPKGWMMHEPYNLRNGTPALALYTYLYRSTRKDAWKGSLQTLSDVVEMPINTVRENLSRLLSRGLLSIEPLAYSHYSIKALRLTPHAEEPDRLTASGTREPDRLTASGTREIGGSRSDDNVSRADSSASRAKPSGSRTDSSVSRTPNKYNSKYNINIKETISRSSSIGEVVPAAPAAANDGLSRKDYIARVLARTLPEYPFAVVYEYASLAGIPRSIVDDFLVHYEQTGWKMNNGGRISNWAAALKNWHSRAKRFEARDQEKARAASSTVRYQAGQPPMSERNRAIYEEEQERKRRERARRDEEDKSAISYEEYLRRKG